MRDPRYWTVDDRTMGGMLRWSTAAHPDRLAVVCGSVRWTWAELNDRANRTANALASLGLGPGDRVALFMTNHADYLALYLAFAKTGVVGVPINPALTASELAFILGDSGSAALVVDDGRAAVAADAMNLVEKKPETTLNIGSEVYRRLLAEAAPTEPAGRVDPAGPYFMCYTSGTTGFPKGCVQSHQAFVEHHWRTHEAFGFGPRDTMLIPGPLFHEAPALFSLAQIFFDGTLVVLEAFTPEDALAAVETEGCTTIGFLVPVMLQRMCAAVAESPHSYDLSRLRSIVVAGAPLLEDTMQAALTTFTETALIEFYGATELGVVTCIDHRAYRGRGRTAGVALPGLTALVLDEDGECCPPGSVGEIFVSPVMMDGYYRRPEADAEAIRVFGDVSWLSLGDLGYQDADGFLHIVDRKKHMIITGGENVYPVEIENVLAEHPGVTDSAVVGLPDQRWGEAVSAALVLADRSISIEELAGFCRSRLAGYKVPRHFFVVDELPRTASGKVMKHVLKQTLASQDSELQSPTVAAVARR